MLHVPAICNSYRFCLYNTVINDKRYSVARLRHCAKTRKVAGSISDGVFEISHWLNTSGRTVALGSTQPLSEISIRYLRWVVKAAGATFVCQLSENPWDPQTPAALRAYTGIDLAFHSYEQNATYFEKHKTKIHEHSTDHRLVRVTQKHS
jgi:hypothetical protein